MWAEPHYLGACASFLFPPPLIAPKISALREEGDLTETVVTRFALYLRLCFGLQSLFILKYIRMYVVRSRQWYTRTQWRHERSFGILGSVKNPQCQGKQWSFTSVYCRSLFMEKRRLSRCFLLLIHAWRLVPFIAPFDVPEAVKSLKHIGGRGEVTYKTWDFYRPMTGKASVTHDPTGLYKRGETSPQSFTFCLEPSREIKTPFLLRVNFLQIPSS